jgi:hypothetical protein
MSGDPKYENSTTTVEVSIEIERVVLDKRSRGGKRVTSTPERGVVTLQLSKIWGP